MRLEMLQVARLSPRSLSDGSELVREFVRRHLHPSGGFMDRAGDVDLYYSVFGLGCMLALDMDVPRQQAAQWLSTFGDGEGLDLIHLCALARCWSGIGGIDEERAAGLLARIEAYRTAEGGYNALPDADYGNPYGNFMALGAFQDLGGTCRDPQELAAGCLACQTADGGFSNERGLPVGNVPAVAASESILRNVGVPMPAGAGDWLLAQAYPQGGFFAVPAAPMPDLLSTATALHALSGMDIDIGGFVDPCLDYLDSLWVNKGSFYGNWGDTILDCEYTFYGLLALGHLSL